MVKCWRCGLALSILPLALAWTDAQPTYKLEVKPHLKPLATIKLEGDRLTRTELKDDAGFRLQYAFKKDGKPLPTVEARSSMSIEIPDKNPGKYVAVLELFYPAYKGGNAQKGQFKAVSNELSYEVKPAAQAGGPVQIVLVEEPKK